MKHESIIPILYRNRLNADSSPAPDTRLQKDTRVQKDIRLQKLLDRMRAQLLRLTVALAASVGSAAVLAWQWNIASTGGNASIWLSVSCGLLLMLALHELSLARRRWLEARKRLSGLRSTARGTHFTADCATPVAMPSAFEAALVRLEMERQAQTAGQS